MLLAMAVLSIPHAVQVFECTRESVFQEFNEIKCRVEQEKQSL
jgi:hypothetical protein